MSKTRSGVTLAVVAVLLLLANFVFTARYVAAQQHQQAQQQAAQQRAGEAELRALCTDLGTMARIPPPGGDPTQNPSRAYEQAENRAWQGLFTGLHCH